MTRRRGVLLGAAAVVGVTVVAIVFASAMRPPPPEQVALEYGRAFYADDADALWSLISEEDHRAKDEETFRRQQRNFRGFTRDSVHELARYIDATPVKTSITGDRASVTLRFRLPDANAPEILALVHDWNEDRLEALATTECERILSRIVALHRERKLPTVEGDETIDLVRDASAWKVALHWADGVRLRFVADIEPGVRLDVSVTPAQASLSRGERLRVTVSAANRSDQEITTRVGYRIQPESQSKHLALLLCPLFVPVTLAADETREFSSEYLLLADAPKDLRALDVTYVFPERTAASK